MLHLKELAQFHNEQKDASTSRFGKQTEVSGGIKVKILELVDWSQVSNQPLQLESVAARVLKLFKLLQASSSFFKALEAAAVYLDQW